MSFKKRRLSIGVLLCATVSSVLPMANASGGLAILTTSASSNVRAFEGEGPDDIGWQADLAVIVQGWKESYPLDVAFFDVTSDHSASIGFANGVPPTLSVPKIAGIEVSLVEQVGYSEKCLFEAGNAVMGAVAKVFQDNRSLKLTVKPKERQFVVEVSNYSLTDNLQMADPTVEEIAAVNQIFKTISLPDKFVGTVQLKPSARVQFQLYDGGEKLYEGSEYRCTAAFSIKQNSSPAQGFLTAGHCPGYNTSYAVANNAILSVYPGSLSTTNTNSAGNGGEFRWLRSSVGLTGYTQVGGSTPRRKFSVAADAGSSSSICVWGWMSGQLCNQHVSSNYDWAPVPIYPTDGTNPDGSQKYIYSGPFRKTTGSCLTKPGDSGGPWFQGNTAVGMHSGCSIPDYPAYTNSYMIYSSAASALSNLDVSLWTQ